jgi:hypothetical protein
VDPDENVPAEGDKAQNVLLPDIGEEIQEAFNAARVVGLDCTECLFLICKNHVYVIDNYFFTKSGEFVDVSRVPSEASIDFFPDLFFCGTMATGLI